MFGRKDKDRKGLRILAGEKREPPVEDLSHPVPNPVGAVVALPPEAHAGVREAWGAYMQAAVSLGVAVVERQRVEQQLRAAVEAREAEHRTLIEAHRVALKINASGTEEWIFSQDDLRFTRTK